MSLSLTPVPDSFPVFVASRCCGAHAFAELVQGGCVRRVSPQFFTWREEFFAVPDGRYLFKAGSVVHSLVAIDYSGRRIALSDGRTPIAWADIRKCIADWDQIRVKAGIKGFSIPYLEPWRR